MGNKYNRWILVAIIFGLLTLIFTTSTPLNVQSQSPDNPQIIESDDPLVIQSGTWAAQSTSEASGGSYLYSSGSLDDVLTLEFEGTSVEIIYVEHAALGSFAIDIDNNIHRTVITTSQETSFGNRAIVNYLEDGHHTLRVYPVEGVIGIDAFITNPVAERVEENSQVEAGICDPNTLPIRASAAADGSVNSGNSISSDISDDGRYVVFSTASPNIVPTGAGVILYDRETCAHSLVSVTSDGQPALGANPRISGDGRFIAFSSSSEVLTGDASTRTMIFVHDRQTGETEPISVGWDGSPTNGSSQNPSISDDGRYVAFESGASNLIPSDTNGTTDVFVFDRQTETTVLATVSSTGVQTNNYSEGSEISGNGRFVTFQSYASNLIDGSTTPVGQIYVHDLQTTETSIVSISSTGEVADGQPYNPTISDDGRFVAFEGILSNLVPDIEIYYGLVVPKTYIHDRLLGENIVAPVNPHNDNFYYSMRPSISGNGQFVAFLGFYLNVPNDRGKLVIYDRINHQTRVIAIDTTDYLFTLQFEGPMITDDGTAITFNTHAADIIDDDNNSVQDIFIAGVSEFNEPTTLIAAGATTTQIDLSWDDNTPNEIAFHVERSINGTDWTVLTSVSANVTTYSDIDINCGQIYLYRVRAEDNNGQFSPYSIVAGGRCRICDANQTIYRASAAPDFTENTGDSRYSDISNDGRYTVFMSYATNLTSVPNIQKGIFLHDHDACEIKLISDFATGEDAVGDISRISSDGNFVVFSATGTVNGTPIVDGIVVYDVVAGTHSIVSVNSSGDLANASSYYPSISVDGRYVAFASGATNLVANDTNNAKDAFVHDRLTGETTRISVSSNGTEGDFDSVTAEISGNGQFVVFLSNASNLVANDTNNRTDAFVHDRISGETTRVSVNSAGEESEGFYALPISPFEHVRPMISNDGRYVVFLTRAGDLVPNDTIAASPDVFLHDRQTGTTVRISENPTTHLSIFDSFDATISGNGRYIAFITPQNDIIDGEACPGLYVYDQVTDEMYCVPTSGAFPTLSDDGSLITFWENEFYGEDGDVYVAHIHFVRPPFDLEGSRITPTQINLSWQDKSSNESGFSIERSLNGTDWAEINTVAENVRAYSDTVVCDIHYYYRVRAFNLDTGAYSSYTNIKQLSTPCPLPAPSNLSATSNGSTQINLAWSDNSSDETAFHIERSLNGTDWTEIITVPADTTTYQDTVDCGTSYHYRVRAFRSGDAVFSTYSNTDQATTLDCPVCAPNQLPIRASTAYDGSMNDGVSNAADISDDGRFIVFQTTSSNLLPDGLSSGIVLYDRQNCTHSLVSQSSLGVAGQGERPHISGNGQFIVFESRDQRLTNTVISSSTDNIFIHDRISATTELITIGWDDSPAEMYGNSTYPSISDDGRYVAFQSYASNLVLNDTNGVQDIFVYDRQTDETTIVSVSSSGELANASSQHAAISGDGNYVAFQSNSTNFVELGSNNFEQIYLHDRQLHTTMIVSVSSSGELATGYAWFPTISDDGHLIAFETPSNIFDPQDTDNAPDIYLYDRIIGETSLVPVAQNSDHNNFYTIQPAISGNGQYVTFITAENIVSGTNIGQVYVFDRLSDQVLTVSKSFDGGLGNEWSWKPKITENGSLIVFESSASNIIDELDNGKTDVYVFGISFPVNPSNLQALPTSPTQINLAWSDNSSDETAFHIERSLNGTDWAEIDTVSADTTAYQDTVDCGTTYHYRVRAFRSGDSLFSTYSNTDQTTSDPCALPAPSNLQATPTSPTQINLAWSDNSSDETAFHVERSLNGTDWSEIDTVSADTTAYQDTVDCNTSYHYRVRAFRSGDGVFSTYSNTDQATSGECISVNPSLIAPLNSTTTDYSALPLTFSWNEATNATWYHLVLTKGTTTVLDAWYQKGNSSMSCNGATCNVVPTVSLSNGAYKWYIHGLTPNGNTQWTPAGNFSIQIPAPAAINKTAPANTATLPNSNVTFTWDRDPNATWYQLSLNGVSTWYGANAVCNASTCSINQTSLENGTYTWYVQGYGVGGSGSWGSPFTFTIEIPKPAIINKLTPIGSQSSATPTFSWTHDSNATWYYLWIGNPTNTFYTQWISASTACSAGTCSFDTGKTFIGNFVWYVYGYGDGGSGPWGSPTNFSYALTLNSPAGNVSGTNITYEWSDAGSTTTYYRLWVGINGGSTVLDQWVSSANCNGSTCSFTASGTIPNGNYTWYIQPYGPTYGNGAWSAPKSFSVNP